MPDVLVLPNNRNLAVSATNSRRVAAIFSLAAIVYLVVGGRLALASVDSLNPDGIAYLRLAEHWAAGNYSLAVSSWWSPLLPWLLILPAKAGADLVVAAKWLSVFAGLGMAGGAAVLASQLGTGGAVPTFVLVLALALPTIPLYVTPDLLSACLLTWYFVAALQLLLHPRRSTGIAVGVLAGLAFLAKAFCLPFVLVHLALTFGLRRYFPRRSNGRTPTTSTAVAIRSVSLALATLACVSLPWIITISAHDGRPLINSAAAYTRRAFAPAVFDAFAPSLPLYRLQQPREGRLTTWENPTEIPYPWPDWEIVSLRGLKWMIKSFLLNVQTVLDVQRRADYLGLAQIAFLVAVFLCWTRRETHFKARSDARIGEHDETIRTTRIWACCSVVLYVLGYCVVLVYDRFLWATWGLASAAGVQAFLALRSEADAGDAPTGALAVQSRVLPFGLVGILLVSATWQAALATQQWPARWPQSMRRQIQALPLKGALVANDWHPGVTAAWWTHHVFLGQFRGRDANTVANELTPYGASDVIVFRDDALADALATDRRFQPLAPARSSPDRGVRALRFTPAAVQER